MLEEYNGLSDEDRQDLISFCVFAYATVKQIEWEYVDENEFERMTDEELIEEAERLDAMMGGVRKSRRVRLKKSFDVLYFNSYRKDVDNE